jgi:hypothetical protein
MTLLQQMGSGTPTKATWRKYAGGLTPEEALVRDLEYHSVGLVQDMEKMTGLIRGLTADSSETRKHPKIRISQQKLDGVRRQWDRMKTRMQGIYSDIDDYEKLFE